MRPLFLTRFNRLPAVLSALICAGIASPVPAEIRTPNVVKERELTQVVSGGATGVVEMVRAGAPGTVIEVFVKVGSPVKKGQCLGHTDLYSTKLNLDIAKANLDAKGAVDRAQAQYKASSIQRAQAEDTVLRRNDKLTNFQLDYARAQEEVAHDGYQDQLDSKKVKGIQLDYWKDEYRRRLFIAPVDGIVSEVLIKPGMSVNYATHAFTIRGTGDYSILVPVPAALAESAVQSGSLMAQPHGGNSLINATVDSVSDDPSAPDEKKILKLFIRGADMPVTRGSKPDGTKFDVFIPN